MVKKKLICGRKCPVDLVVRRHERPWVTIPDSNLERLSMNLTERPRGDASIDEEAARLLVVCGKVLYTGTDAMGLDSIDKSAGELSGEEGVFAVGLEVAAAEGRSRNADGRSENHIHFLALCLCDDDVAKPLEKLKIPRGSEGDTISL
jgi:hypothetical protein